MATRYQLRIELVDSTPLIWRQIAVDSSIKLADLHKALQTTMGWTNSHLHQFVHQKKRYSAYDPDNDYWDTVKDVDYKKVRLHDLLVHVNDSMVYEYDFGDDWEHSILLEKIDVVPEEKVKPICLNGAKRCPPEDVGGTGGYEEMLDIIKDTSHPEYRDYLDWLGEKFDPNAFDAVEITRQLQKKNNGMLSFEESIQVSPFGEDTAPNKTHEGYSALEMSTLVESPYSESCPIQIKPLSAEVLASIPLLNLCKFLMETIRAAGELKLTPTGMLPQKVVMSMKLTGYIRMQYDHPEAKVVREYDDHSFMFTRQLLQQSGLVKVRNNKLSLTQKGAKLYPNDDLLFKHLLLKCSTTIDWSSMDGYENQLVGSYGFAFVLKLLKSYGNERRLLHFYAEKFLKSFSFIIDLSHSPSFYSSPIDYSMNCFTHRSLKVILCYFGFASIEEERRKPYGIDYYLKPTPLFEKVFEVK